MSNKLRYGTHFTQSIASTNYRHDGLIDDSMYKDHMRHIAIYNALPLYKKELRGHATRQRNSKRKAARWEAGAEREEAELRMAEAIRKVVGILEFHMEDMMQHRKVAGRQSHVCQPKLHNILVDLRTKCGVQFDRGGQYDHHVDMGRLHINDPSDKELDLRAEQHAARERRMREVTDRLLARPRK